MSEKLSSYPIRSFFIDNPICIKKDKLDELIQLTKDFKFLCVRQQIIPSYDGIIIDKFYYDKEYKQDIFLKDIQQLIKSIIPLCNVYDNEFKSTVVELILVFNMAGINNEDNIRTVIMYYDDGMNIKMHVLNGLKTRKIKGHMVFYYDVMKREETFEQIFG